MNWYETLPQDIIEYISKKLYNEFTYKVKKKYQIKKDAILANQLQIRERVQYYYINNLYNLYNNNYNLNINNYIINNINHSYNNNIDNIDNIDSDSDSFDYSDMPELISIESDTEEIFN